MVKSSSMLMDLQALIPNIEPMVMAGKVTRVAGLSIESCGPNVQIGSICRVLPRSGQGHVMAEVVGFKGETVLSMPLGEMLGIEPGATITSKGRHLEVRVGEGLIGRVLDGLGQPLDGRPLPPGGVPISTYAVPPNPLARNRISEVLPTGVRVIDALLTCGRGQRFGIFAGSGVGKSTLLGMIARHSRADLNVIALVGERGRELREFIERDLGPEGMARSVVVVATSDKPALVRLKAAAVATSIAEYFRNEGCDVVLMMDSVTRYAMAQREVGLAVGEPPASRGYTPSVFALLPKLLERAGTSDKGTITGIYTVLVDGDDMNEPIADAVRGILDGHIILSRNIAARNHYPPIDVLGSVSRVASDICPSGVLETAREAKRYLAAYEGAKDLIEIGAYVRGSNPEVDRALELKRPLDVFLRQDREEYADCETAWRELASILRS